MIFVEFPWCAQKRPLFPPSELERHSVAAALSPSAASRPPFLRPLWLLRYLRSETSIVESMGMIEVLYIIAINDQYLQYLVIVISDQFQKLMK